MESEIPEKLFVPARVENGPDGGIEMVKASGPDGRVLPIAFTSLDYLKHFAGETGLDKAEPPVGHVEIATEELFSQLVSAGEPELCIDAMQECEQFLSYSRRGAVSRQTLDDGSSMEVREPSEPFEAEALAQLCQVAYFLPTIETIWLLELVVTDAKGNESPPRPLLVVKQNVEEESDAFHSAFMELGDQWCEQLQRGTAIDMLPHDAPPVKDQLKDTLVVYRRG